MTSCTFSKNKVGQRAIIDVVQRSSLTMTSVTFSENTSEQDSSVIYMSDAIAASMTSCTFEKNKSKNGGNTITLIFSGSILFKT